MRKKQIPLRIRSFIALRDNGICQICGKIGQLKSTYFGYMAFEKIPAWSCRGKGSVNGIHKNYISFEIDHIKPEFHGGEIIIENLQLVCRNCNRSKGKKDNGK